MRARSAMMPGTDLGGSWYQERRWISPCEYIQVLAGLFVLLTPDSQCVVLLIGEAGVLRCSKLARIGGVLTCAELVQNAQVLAYAMLAHKATVPMYAKLVQETGPYAKMVRIAEVPT